MSTHFIAKPHGTVFVAGQQALWVSTIGLVLSMILVAVRGLPAPAPVAASQTCAAPTALDLAPPSIGAEAAHKLAERAAVAFVDCRSPEEYQEGHVAGAVNLPAEQLVLSDGAKALLGSAPTIVTYCDEACARSTKVAQHVIAAGFSNVRIMEGGIAAWLNAGYAAESGICPLCEDR